MAIGSTECLRRKVHKFKSKAKQSNFLPKYSLFFGKAFLEHFMENERSTFRFCLACFQPFEPCI